MVIKPPDNPYSQYMGHKGYAVVDFVLEYVVVEMVLPPLANPFRRTKVVLLRERKIRL